MALESLPWSHGEFVMEGFSSGWNLHQDPFPQNVDELKQKLLSKTWELKNLQATAAEELRKKDETIHKLVNLVNLTKKERDEVKEQLNALLSCLSSKKQQHVGAVNSGLTESDSLSDTQTRNNRHSYVSSPVESFYHADSSNITNAATTGVAASYDYGSIIIDELAKKRLLPEKGKLLQSVINAGPILQTLMVAGPLPTWRNPPPLQAFQPTRFAMDSTNMRSPLNFANGLGFHAKRQMGSGLDSLCEGNLGAKRLKNI
ncbi:enabled-like protein (DUF1635) [Rhynchospora pubera]|uniref:Enabled-like protein (DUF1635) n=1 Tax=Rhynchospora pubera TaxID=906938 RepID=A0AAV8E3L6_9POAL|nr:enabled-like protein (DUF1635) [Rhynchospora pubera]